MSQSSPANVEMMRKMIYEEVSGVSNNRGGDKCGEKEIPASLGLIMVEAIVCTMGVNCI